MKNKRLLYAMLGIFSAVALSAGLAACDDPEEPERGGNAHDHAFTQEVAEEKYLKSAADCTQKAVYYKSCSCGVKGADTFEYGQPNGHSFTRESAEPEYLKTEASCTAKAVYYKSCSCGEKGADTFEYGELKDHSYTKETAEEEYLLSQATCTKRAVYYKSCECGKKSETATFEAGLPLSHDYRNGECSVCRAKTPSEGLTYLEYSDRCYVTGIGTCTDTDLVIPAVYHGKIVAGINSNAFENNDQLDSVVIHEGVKSIGKDAFFNCGSLTSVTVPQSVTEIGQGAFNLCDALTIYCVASAMDYGPNWNAGKCPVVYDCKTNDLSAPVFPNPNCYVYIIQGGVRYALLDNDVFGDASLSYTAAVIAQPKKIATANIFGTVSYKDNTYTVASISQNAFQNCKSLTSVTIPNGVATIGCYAFSGCSAATVYCEAAAKKEGWDDTWNRFGPTSENEIVTVWNCGTNDLDGNGYAYTVVNGIRFSIKDGAAAVARQPVNLSSVTIPRQISYRGKDYLVTAIESYAFLGSHAVSVTIPDTVTVIGDSAFNNSLITTLCIPKGVTSIGKNVIGGCLFLTDIRFAGTKEEWKSLGFQIDQNVGSGNCTVTCTDGKLDRNGNDVA